MRQFRINERHDGKRLDNTIKDIFRNMPENALFKAFRLKDIRVNGTRADRKTILKSGDNIEIFIADDVLDGLPKRQTQAKNPGFSVVYEDKQLIIVNKEQGIPVHSGKNDSTKPLIDRVAEYLSSEDCHLCHRIDRNTSGLVVIAKNKQSLDILLDKFKNKGIKKYYQCLVSGSMEKSEGILVDYMVKDEKQSKVFINKGKIPKGKEIATHYRVLWTDKEITRLEIELMTGRTHQIRAHLAYIGHPVIGDGKYGINSINKKYGMKRQALCAYKLVFTSGRNSPLDYLDGKIFEVTPDFQIRSGEGRMPCTACRSKNHRPINCWTNIFP